MDHIGSFNSFPAAFPEILAMFALFAFLLFGGVPGNEGVETIPNMRVLESQLDKSTLLVMRDSSVQVIQKVNSKADDFYHSDATVAPLPHSLRGTTSISELRSKLQKGEVQAVISPDHPRYEEVAVAFVRQNKVDLSQ